jgi:hypothetical protein
MTYTQPRKPTEALSYSDRQTIADVLNWDEVGSYHYHPNEIEAFAIKGDLVDVRLTGCRTRPVSRYLFRAVLEAKKANAQKYIDQIVEIEEVEVLEAERELSEIIQTTAQEEFDEFMLSSNYDWLTEPIGASLDYIFGMTGEQQAEFLPAVENAYHQKDWTSEGCEF